MLTHLYENVYKHALLCLHFSENSLIEFVLVNVILVFMLIMPLEDVKRNVQVEHMQIQPQ